MANPEQQKVAPDSIFYQFSPEETKVMSDCNRESFFQRSLPLSVITGAGAYIAVNAGYLKRNLKYGPWPKIMFGSMLGYLVGKYSYQAICAERLMQLPNSELGRILRERRGKANGELFKGNLMTPSITPGTTGTDIPSFSTDYKSNIDIDMHKPTNTIDTDYNPNYDDSLLNKTNEIPLSSFDTSYEELRARNRNEYERTQPNKPIYRPPPPPNSQPIWDNQPYYPPAEPIRNPQPRESRNQYGDVFNN